MQTPIHTMAPEKRPSGRERALSILVMALLGIILTAVLAIQSHYEPARWRAQPLAGSNTPATGGKGADEQIPAGLAPLTPPESYGPANLSDKIDGKAEFYLAAGFEGLQTRRFALQEDSQIWLERYVYDMGRFRNAFAVFSGQRRPNSQPLALAADAYLAANGLFLVQGRYYLEIIASQASPALDTHMKALARAFVQTHVRTGETLAATRRFPTQNRLALSTALIPANAFGLDQLDWVYTAQYQWDQAQATAFLSPRESAAEARRLAQSFGDFLQDYGGQALSVPDALEGSRIIAILDSFDIIFVHGTYLAGVHEASDIEHAVQLAQELRRALQETPDEP